MLLLGLFCLRDDTMCVKTEEIRNYFGKFLQIINSFVGITTLYTTVFATFLVKHGQTQGQWDYT